MSKAQELNGRHVFHVKDFYASSNKARPSRTGISYHGGTVIAGPAITKVVAIYWGSSSIYAGQSAGTGSGASDGTLIGSFLRSLGGSPYFNINTTYYDASNSKVLNQVGYTSFWTVGTECSGAVGESRPTRRWSALISVRTERRQDRVRPEHGVRDLHSASGINLGGGFGSQYCAYHTHGARARRATCTTPRCRTTSSIRAAAPRSTPRRTADVAANSEVNTLAHEIEETTTDAMGNAWFDSRGYENADKCAWTWGTVKTAPNGGRYNMQLADGNYYLVQRNWVNAGSGGCALSF